MAKANPRAARERKQKIFVAVGGLMLLALLAIQLPKIMGGSASEASATTETTVAGEEATPTPGVPSGAVPAAVVETGGAAAAGTSQLRSFGVFDRKDPFVQQIKDPEEAGDGGGGTGDAGSGDGGNGGDGSGGKNEPPPSEDFSTDDPAAPVATVISVNGTRQALERGRGLPGCRSGLRAHRGEPEGEDGDRRHRRRLVRERRRRDEASRRQAARSRQHDDGSAVPARARGGRRG